jgi:ubiquinone/menaquinone biosynthesis C-methylase UbiE
VTSAYDTAAPSFERHRVLPGRVPEAIRAAILRSINASSPPRLLDLGAGTGRIGRPFVVAGDDYVGVDMSFGMLREFARRAGPNKGCTPRLVQADGERLPFRDASFDAVMLIQVVAAARNWQHLVNEGRRVLRSPGALVIGHTVVPSYGLDARMKQRLASLLDDMGAPSYPTDVRIRVQDSLASIAQGETRVVTVAWNTERTPRRFLERQLSGAQFSRLPDTIKEDALRNLSAWAAATFGSLDAAFTEQHVFELRIFDFHDGRGH